jgi:hypothetical protein
LERRTFDLHYESISRVEDSFYCVSCWEVQYQTYEMHQRVQFTSARGQSCWRITTVCSDFTKHVVYFSFRNIFDSHIIDVPTIISLTFQQCYFFIDTLTILILKTLSSIYPYSFIRLFVLLMLLIPAQLVTIKGFVWMQAICTHCCFNCCSNRWSTSRLNRYQ